jgi:hypothetical protein
MLAPQAIDAALDLARMPALARTLGARPIPPDVLELMKIAAGSEDHCRAAAARTGQREEVLIQAARFYLQQILFRTDADSYRILGLASGASKDRARVHMAALLQWLHPDRNNGLEALYAHRVIAAWQQISGSESGDEPRVVASNVPEVRRPRRPHSAKLAGPPWIRIPSKKRSSIFSGPIKWGVVGVVCLALVISTAVYYFAPDFSRDLIAEWKP